ncbi:MAG: hypothetical protein QW727_02685 [Candidatus Pacearchaeota archaeon]
MSSHRGKLEKLVIIDGLLVVESSGIKADKYFPLGEKIVFKDYDGRRIIDFEEACAYSIKGEAEVGGIDGFIILTLYGNKE